MPREGDNRLTIANKNVPNMVGQISTCLADAGLNIHDMLNKSRGDIAYTLVDLDGVLQEETMSRIRAIDGVLSARIV
jgi:D-3-phosphoglycerate dehydrogenase